MRILKVLFREKKKRKSGFASYEQSIYSTGREQFKRLTEKGLRVPVFLL